MAEAFSPLGENFPTFSSMYFVLALVVVAFGVVGWPRKMPLVARWSFIISGIVTMAMYHVGFPTGWVQLPLYLGLGLSFAAISRKNLALGRWVFAACAIIFSLFGTEQVFLGTHSGFHLSLQSGQIEYRSRFESGNLPRNGLRVSLHDDWYSIGEDEYSQPRWDNDFVF